MAGLALIRQIRAGRSRPRSRAEAFMLVIVENKLTILWGSRLLQSDIQNTSFAIRSQAGDIVE